MPDIRLLVASWDVVEDVMPETGSLEFPPSAVLLCRLLGSNVDVGIPPLVVLPSDRPVVPILPKLE